MRSFLIDDSSFVASFPDVFSVSGGETTNDVGRRSGSEVPVCSCGAVYVGGSSSLFEEVLYFGISSFDLPFSGSCGEVFIVVQGVEEFFDGSLAHLPLFDVLGE